MLSTMGNAATESFSLRLKIESGSHQPCLAVLQWSAACFAIFKAYTIEVGITLSLIMKRRKNTDGSRLRLNARPLDWENLIFTLRCLHPN